MPPPNVPRLDLRKLKEREERRLGDCQDRFVLRYPCSDSTERDYFPVIFVRSGLGALLCSAGGVCHFPRSSIFSHGHPCISTFINSYRPLPNPLAVCRNVFLRWFYVTNMYRNMRTFLESRSRSASFCVSRTLRGAGIDGKLLGS